MPQSMTGYGRGEATQPGLAVVVELKSVNNRFRDLQIRAPREYSALEPRVRALLEGQVARGRVDAFVRRRATTSPRRLTTDPSLARAYVEAMRELANELPGVTPDVTLSLVLAQPGVLTIDEDEGDVTGEWPVVEGALTEALDALVAMRRAEGASLVGALEGFTREVERIVDEVDVAVASVARAIQQRLHARLERLLTEAIDPTRLAQEVALLADKADISEEITRMRSHLAQFRDALGSDEPVGRRLEFLLQEMNREANTMGSKTVDHAVSANVVAFKTLLERMREQSANLQ